MHKTVLVVEDEFLIAMDLQRMLEAHDWRVIGPAGNVGEALRLLGEEVPDVALLDVNLAGELVTPVAEALTARGVPFALSSAYDTPTQYAGTVLADARNLGKPATERQIVTALDAMVGRGDPPPASTE